MAINQASLFLFPPRFGPIIKVLDREVTEVSAALIDPNAPRVGNEEIRQWLFARSFAEKERYGGVQVLVRGCETTFIGSQALIDLTVPLDEDENEELNPRFLLSEKTPAHIPEWKDLIGDLGNDFGFRILGPEQELLPCVDFFTVLAQNRDFRFAADRFGWQL